MKGYCVPLKCQGHRDCLVGDFCNGGLLISGICKTSNKKGYKSCIYDQLNIRTEKKEKEDIPPFGKMRLTYVLKKSFSLLNSMQDIHRLMLLFDKKSKFIYSRTKL